MALEGDLGADVESPEVDPTVQAAQALRDGGDELAALKLELKAAQDRLARSESARRATELSTYRTELSSEFEYADPTLITGKTKKEMRASAERLHKAVEAVIEKKGLRAGGEDGGERKRPTASDFGAPPPVAKEVITADVPMEFAELSEKARTGELTRAQVLKDIKNNGPREINRPTIRGAIQGRQTAAQN